MRISFAHVDREHRYPVGRAELGAIVQGLFPEFLLRIAHIRVICSTRGSRLGSVVWRTGGATIAVNFCTVNGISRLLSTRDDYLAEIKLCGGRPDVADGNVQWSDAAARKYLVFLLGHEIGH